MRTNKVWMSTFRKGLAFHLVDVARTVCGRYVGRAGQDPPAHGVLLDAEEAIAIGATECKTCYQPDGRTQPVVTTDRTDVRLPS